MLATLKTGIFEDTHGNAPRPSWGKGELCPYRHTDGTTSHEHFCLPIAFLTSFKGRLFDGNYSVQNPTISHQFLH